MFMELWGGGGGGGGKGGFTRLHCMPIGIHTKWEGKSYYYSLSYYWVPRVVASWLKAK